MGQRDIRRLLIIGAMAVIRGASLKGKGRGEAGCISMLARKPRMLLAIALANKMARAIWAMLTRGEDYRVPAAAALWIHDRTLRPRNAGRVRRSANGKGK